MLEVIVRQRNLKILTGGLVAVALTAPCVLGQTLSDGGEARFAYNLTIQDRVPFWNGALIIVEHNGLAAPTIHSFDITGAEMPPIVLAISGANATRIESVAYGKDGTYAACGRALDANGRGGNGFVAWISPDRQNTKVIQTFPYVPYSIVMTADGSTWTQGFEIANGRESDPAVNLEHGIIRRFDKSGNLLSSYIPRSTIRRGTFGLEQGLLAASKDYIGWYANREHAYREVTSDGKIASYPGIGPSDSKWEVTGLAITDSGDVIISATERIPNRIGSRLYRLDKSHRAWLRLDLPNGTAAPMPDKPYLLGADGNRLVLYRIDRMRFVDYRD
jgi:hypothetical protein